MPPGSRSRSCRPTTAISSSAVCKRGPTRCPSGGGHRRESASVAYKLVIKLDGQQDNAPPLVDGPAPALQISLATAGPISGEIPTGDGAGSGSSSGDGAGSGSSSGDGAGSGSSSGDGAGSGSSTGGGPVNGALIGGPVNIVSIGGPVNVASTGGPVSGPWPSVEGSGIDGGSATTGSAGEGRVDRQRVHTGLPGGRTRLESFAEPGRGRALRPGHEPAGRGRRPDGHRGFPGDPGRAERPFRRRPGLRPVRREPGHADEHDLGEPRGRRGRVGGCPLDVRVRGG